MAVFRFEKILYLRVIQINRMGRHIHIPHEKVGQKYQ